MPKTPLASSMVRLTWGIWKRMREMQEQRPASLNRSDSDSSIWTKWSLTATCVLPMEDCPIIGSSSLITRRMALM